MIPAPVVGAAILTIGWMTLWWLAGGRHDHSPLGCRVIAGAWGVLCIHEASRYQNIFMAAFYLALTIQWALRAQAREQARWRLRARNHPVTNSNTTDT